jgi:hypothetical protein
VDPRLEEVGVDDFAARDVWAGGVNGGQPHVPAHDREGFLGRPQEGTKACTEASVVLYRPDELVADILEGHLIDDAVPAGRARWWPDPGQRRGLAAIDPQAPTAPCFDADAGGAEECEQAADPGQPTLKLLTFLPCDRLA